MKPILDPKLQAEQEAARTSGHSLVVPDQPKTLQVKPKPIVVKQPTIEMKVETVKKPVATPATTLLGNDERPRIPDAHALADPGPGISPGGKPLPVRKPVMTAIDQNAPYTPPEKEAVHSQPTEVAEVPRPPEVEPVHAVDIVPPAPMAIEDVPMALAKPGSSIRIERNRFSSQSRMAGMTMEYDTTNSEPSVPHDLGNLRIGKLEEAEGVSPIIIPRAPIMHAPEIANAAGQKIPPEVIVFFQENSDELDVGQIDILDSDVINLLKSRPDLDVEIVGYAAAPGGNKDNAKRLSHARAVMIRNYLVRKRIDASRVEVTARANDTRIDPLDRADLFFSR